MKIFSLILGRIYLCPFSLFLFSIVLQVIISTIRKGKEIKPVWLERRSKTISSHRRYNFIHWKLKKIHRILLEITSSAKSSIQDKYTNHFYFFTLDSWHEALKNPQNIVRDNKQVPQNDSMQHKYANYLYLYMQQWTTS